MRILSRALIALLLSSAAVEAAPVLDLTGGVTRFAYPAAYTIGWQFTSTVPLSVNALGFWDEGSDGVLGSHEVGLWTSSGTLLGSLTLTNANSTAAASSSTDGRWLFTSLAAPILLAPGTYVVGAEAGTDPMRSFTAVTTIPGVTYENGKSTTTSLTFPADTLTVCIGCNFGPNVSATSVPEPASLLLLGSGLAAIAWRRRGNVTQVAERAKDRRAPRN